MIDWVRSEHRSGRASDDWEMTLHVFFNERYPQTNFAPATLAKVRQAINWLRRSAPVPSAVNRAAVIAMIQQAQTEKKQNETILSVLAAAKVVTGWLHENGIIEQQPIDKRLMNLRPKNPRIRQDKHLKGADMALMLDRADYEFDSAVDSVDRWYAARLRSLVYLLAFTGLRKSEALRLRRSRWNGQTLLVLADDHPLQRLKTYSSEREVPVPPAAACRLAQWLQIAPEIRPGRPEPEWIFTGARKDVPWINGSAGSRALNQLQALASRAGVSKWVTMHALRHTFATHAIHSAGFSAPMLAMAMGHSNTYTQAKYVHQDVDAMASAMGQIRYERLVQASTGTQLSTELVPIVAS